jgi:hypothetical protein
MDLAAHRWDNERKFWNPDFQDDCSPESMAANKLGLFGQTPNLLTEEPGLKPSILI